MADVFVYDRGPHPAGPRQEGRKPARSALCRASPHACSKRCATATGSTPKGRRRVMGCVDAIYEAGGDIARAATFEAGYATEAPGIQINRFCASGLDAINFGAAKIAQGADDIVIAGGVESMSRIGIGASGRRLVHGSVGQHPGLFHAAGHFRRPDRHKYGFSRDDVDAYAVESQKRAAKAGRRATSTSRWCRSRTSTA
jgi:acetyl-CoA C-acetyltransferase